MSLTPRTRPDNLPIIEIDQLPDEPPVALPGGSDDVSILKWAEANRDYFEERGNLLSLAGLKALSRRAGLSDDDAKSLRKQLSRLFASEADSVPAAAATVPVKAKKAKVKAKTKPTPAKAKTKPKKEKQPVVAAASKNGTGKHGKKKPKRGNPKLSKQRHGESKEIYRKKVRGILVIAHQTEGDQFRVSIGGVTVRKLAQWMGADGWETPEAYNVLTRLIARVPKLTGTINKQTVKGPEGYVRMILNGGHLGSGAACAKTKFKAPGAFGMAPRNLDKTLVKTLHAMKKAV